MQQHLQRTDWRTIGQQAVSHIPCSVLIFTYNSSTSIVTTIESLRTQTLPYNQFEVIVIDLGSTDSTVQTIHSYLQLHIQPGKLLEQLWRVRCIAKPAGDRRNIHDHVLEHAQGNICIFLGADCTAEPDWLEEVLLVYSVESSIDAVQGGVDLYWKTPKPHWYTSDFAEYSGVYFPSAEKFLFTQATALPENGFRNFSCKRSCLTKLTFTNEYSTHYVAIMIDMYQHSLLVYLQSLQYKILFNPTIVTHRIISESEGVRQRLLRESWWKGHVDALVAHAEHKHSENLPDTYERQAVLQSLLQYWNNSLLYLLATRQSTTDRTLIHLKKERSRGQLHQQVELLAYAHKRRREHSVQLYTPRELDGRMIIYRIDERTDVSA